MKVLAIRGMLTALVVSLAGEVSPGYATPMFSPTGLPSPAVMLTFAEIVLPPNTLLTNQYQSFGISFTGVFYDGCNNCVQIPQDPDIGNFSNNNTGSFTSSSSLVFAAPQTRAAFSFASNGGAFAMSSYLNNVLVETFSFNGTQWQYYGFTQSLFDEIRLSTPSAMLIDNVQYDSVATIPEPTSITLIAGGVAALAARRRRQPRRKT